LSWNEIQAKFEESNKSQPVLTSMDGNQKLKKPDKEGTNEELLYQNLTRSMMYFCLDQTRCYIRISALSQLNVSYRQEHWITAKGVLRYLKGTWN